MKLTQYFSDRDDYDFGKISTGCCGDEDERLLACGSADQLRRNLAIFREALPERCVLLSADFSLSELNEEIELGDYALRELRKYFCGDPTSTLNQKSSQIFAVFVKHKFHLLSETAKELTEALDEA